MQVAADNNYLSGTLALATMPYCYLLELGTNRLSGTISSNLSLLTALEYLFLGQNYLSGTVPSLLGKLTALTTLDIKDNLLVGSSASQSKAWRKLTMIYIYGNSGGCSIALNSKMPECT